MSGLKSGEMIATLSWGLSGSDRTQTITMGMTNVSAATASDLITLWDLATWNDAGAAMRPALLDDDYTILRSTLTLNRAGVITSAETIINTPGSVGGSAPPPQTCINVKKVTGLTNRKYRGRFFMPGAYITRSDIDELGIIDTGVLAGVNTILSDMYTDLATDFSMVPAILHLRTAEAATVVTSLVAQASVGTIRHRKPRL